MQRTISSHDLDLLREGLAAAGIRLSADEDTLCSYPLHCCFINNPDGSLRWIWPADQRNASFLRFYHTGSFRARIMALLIRCCLALGLGRFVISGRCTLYGNDRLASLVHKFPGWSLFTGTVGENRKLIAWIRNRDFAAFAKIPVSAASGRNIRNEAMALDASVVEGINRPTAFLYRQAILIQSDVFGQHDSRVPSAIADLPQQPLRQWMAHGLEQQPLGTTNWWKSAGRKMEGFTMRNDRYHTILLERLEELMQTFSSSELVPVAPAHGDFTPWNMRCNDQSITLIDWELYNDNRPALSDLFHFIYQNHILIRRTGFAAIRREIDALLDQQQWRTFLEEQEIDAATAEQLYLIHTITYYLDVFNRQYDWHQQVSWLLQCWCEALGYWLQQKQQITSKQVLIQDMVHFLRHESYAVLKLDEQNLTHLPDSSDIDMCITRKAADRLVQKLRSHNNTGAVHVKKQSFIYRVSVVLRDNTFLHLDLIWSLRRKHLVFMNARDILAHAVFNQHGVKVPLPKDDLAYVWLFYLLNRADVPQRYREAFSNSMGYNGACDALAASTNRSVDQLMTYTPALRNDILAKLSSKKVNRGLYLLKNKAAYMIDTLRQLWPSKGYLATFSGVDGAGKSTVINNIARRVEKEMRMPVVVLRHRPSILPILSAWKYGRKGAEERSVASMPRMGEARPGLGSALRFGYYYMDYLLGQFYVQLRYVHRGYVVLYDRYYFDFINDAKRSNISVPSGLSYHMYKLLIKPRFNFFLFAPTDVILKRKQELDEPTINMLTTKYLNLFTRLQQADRHRTYQAICNTDLDATLDTIFTNLKNHRICAA